MVPMMDHHGVPFFEINLRVRLWGGLMGTFGGLIEAGSSGAITSMPPPWKSMWGGTSDAYEKVAASPTRGAVRRDCW